jgi:hypothetical protein
LREFLLGSFLSAQKIRAAGDALRLFLVISSQWSRIDLHSASRNGRVQES